MDLETLIDHGLGIVTGHLKRNINRELNDYLLVSGLHRCSKCTTIKLLDDFYQDHSGNRYGIKETCRKCRQTSRNLYYQSKPDQWRKWDLINKYGLTEDQYNEMLTSQEHVCAICKQPETKRSASGELYFLSVDHDHKTGIVRGLLCNDCNNGLGKFKDNVESLRVAINYLGGTV